MVEDQPVEQGEAGEATRRRVIQPALFEVGTDGRLRGHVGIMPDLTPESSLSVARYWYRRYLEQSGHPPNTVKSYSYDLAVFENIIGPLPIGQIRRRHIALFLDETDSRSTRKRRLTSVSGLFKYLVDKTHVLEADPTEPFYPDHIPLKTPHPLFADEQAALLAAAEQDSPRAPAAIWLMLRLGLTRGEVNHLKREHIDRSTPDQPVVYIYYDNPRHQGRERKLAAGPEFAPILQRLIEASDPDEEALFPIPPQTINVLVERVARAPGLNRHVSPQTLRDTFAVDRAREGADEDELLQLLGLADDARNRVSVQRYLKLAAPPLLTGDAAPPP